MGKTFNFAGNKLTKDKAEFVGGVSIESGKVVEKSKVTKESDKVKANELTSILTAGETYVLPDGNDDLIGVRKTIINKKSKTVPPSFNKLQNGINFTDYTSGFYINGDDVYAIGVGNVQISNSNIEDIPNHSSLKDGTKIGNIAKYDSTSGTWSGLQGGTVATVIGAGAAGANLSSPIGKVYAIEKYGDNLYIAGHFNTLSGALGTNSFARYDLNTNGFYSVTSTFAPYIWDML